MIREVGPDPLVWDQESRRKQRKVDVRVIFDFASLPGPLGFLHGPQVQVHDWCRCSCLALQCQSAVQACWFLQLLALACRLWGYIGHFGISYLAVLILFEQWAGHRFLNEKFTRSHVRANRPISISSALVSEGTKIRQGCRFISCLVRALGKLHGGLGRFLPWHMSRLRHLWWDQCSHSFSSRPL